jgi:hypothetical protein
MPLRMGFVMAPAYVVDTGHESEFECFRQERLRLLEPRGSDFLQVGIGLLHRLGCGRVRQQGGNGHNQASAGYRGGYRGASLHKPSPRNGGMPTGKTPFT